MSFLDEQTVTTDDEKKAADLAKQGVDVKLVDKVDEKKKDHDGDGDIDSDDYLIARDKAIKKAMGKKVEEGAASKFLGALGIAAALLAVGNQNKSDSVLKAIDAKIEQADNPAEKAALKKLASQRLIWLDTGKGPGGDIKVSDVGAVLKELSEKSCGCGQTPCKTYGKVSEGLGDALEGGIKDFISGRKMDFVSMAKGLEKIKELNLTPEEEELFKNTLSKIKKGEEPFKKDSKEEKNFFKLCVKAKLDKKEIGLIKVAIKAIRDKNSTNENMSEDKEKTVELPADTTFTLDLKHLMKKHMNEGKSKEDAIKFTKALMKKLHDKGEVTVDGTKIIFKEADVPQDAPLALPEPEAPDYLGADGKDYEGSMAKSQMLKMKNYAKALCDMVDDETQLEAWVQAKITKASDYMSAVYHYLDYQKSKMNEESTNIGKYPISTKDFESYVKEYVREIMAAKKYTSKEDWAIAEPVTKYLLKAKTPTNIDEFIKWHDGAKEITGGKSFGMGSGFADASDGMIIDILTDNPNLTDKDIDLIDLKILPYIQMKAK